MLTCWTRTCVGLERREIDGGQICYLTLAVHTLSGFKSRFGLKMYFGEIEMRIHIKRKKILVFSFQNSI